MRQLRAMFRIPEFVLLPLLTCGVALFLIPLVPNAAFPQVPSDLHGQWSTDQSRCEDNQSEGVTIFNISDKEIGWYEIDCDISSVRQTRDGAALRVDCEKGGGIKGSGDIGIRRVTPDAIEVHVSPLGFSTELNYSLRRCQIQQKQGSQTQGLQTIVPASSRPRTHWNHNGSLMYLEASGSIREFYYEMPRPGMLEAGARPGALLFSGEAVGDTYRGTAYIFNANCGKFGYRVSGPILDNYRRVVMQGQAPRVNRSCRITGYVTDILEFELIDR